MCQQPSDVVTAHCQLPRLSLVMLFISSLPSSQTSPSIAVMFGNASLMTRWNILSVVTLIPTWHPKSLWYPVKPIPEAKAARCTAYDTTFRRDSLVDMDELEKYTYTTARQAMLMMAELLVLDDLHGTKANESGNFKAMGSTD